MRSARGYRQRGSPALATSLTFLAILILAPSTAGEASTLAQGDVVVQGEVEFPTGTNATVTALRGLVAADLTTDLTVNASMGSARVCFTTARFIAIDGGVQQIFLGSPQGPQADCKIRHDVRLTAQGGRDDADAGFVGIYSDTMTAQVFAQALTAGVENGARITSHSTSESPPNHKPNEHAEFVGETTEETVVAHAQGSIYATGSGQLKLRGLDVRLSSAEGEESFSTGARNDVAEQVITWLFVDFLQGQATIQSPRPIQLLADEISTTSDGKIRFTPLAGTLVAGEETYIVPEESRAGKMADVVGRLSATLRPDASNRQALGALALQGDLRATTLTKVPVAGPMNEQNLILPVLFVALVGVGGVAGGGLVLVRRRLQRLRADDVEAGVAYYRYYAELAEALEDFDLALAYLEPALYLRPSDPDLLLEKMLYLRHAGELEEAIRVGEKAAALAPRASGVVDYYIAAIYMETRDSSRFTLAHTHLERALAREPGLAGTIEQDPIFRPLHGADFRAMGQEARLRAAYARRLERV